MRYVLILMVVIGCQSWAGAQSNSSADDPLAEAMRINEAIAQLAVEFPVVIEIEELNALQSEAWSESSSRIRELHATPGESVRVSP